MKTSALLNKIKISNLIYVLGKILNMGDGCGEIISINIEKDEVKFTYLSDSGMSSSEITTTRKISELIADIPQEFYIPQAIDFLKSKLY